MFLHKDYLASILAITDEVGTKLEQRHFDAWGNLTHLKIGNNAIITDKEQISNYLSDGTLVVDRGYTSHEHFAEVGLIHMNGRLYDPLLRRFLNADENIQDQYNTQNYNKYGYVMNNPLMYNDPSGEFIGFILAAVKIVAAIYATFQTVKSVVGLITGKISLGTFAKNVFFTVLSSVVSYGIGDLFRAGGEVVKAFGDFAYAAQAGAHALAQGVLSVMQGDKFLEGAAAGFLGSLAATGTGRLIKNQDFRGIGQIFSGAVAGGVGAELVGGNFWRGASIGSVVATFNHTLHDDPPIGYKGNEYTDETGHYTRSSIESPWQNHTTGVGFIEDVIITKPKVDVIGNIAVGLGINMGVKEVLFNQAKKFGNLSKGAGNYLKFTKRIGFIGGGYDLYKNVNIWYKNPSIYNTTKLGLSALSFTNPWVGLGLGIMDATGATDWILTTVIGK